MLRIRSQQMRLAARGLQLWRVPGLATGWLRRRITGGGATTVSFLSSLVAASVLTTERDLFYLSALKHTLYWWVTRDPCCGEMRMHHAPTRARCLLPMPPALVSVHAAADTHSSAHFSLCNCHSRPQGWARLQAAVAGAVLMAVPLPMPAYPPASARSPRGSGRCQ